MTPQGQPIFLGGDFDAMVRGFEQSIEDGDRVGRALSEFLGAAFPQAFQQGVTLGSAVAAYLNSGKREHVDALKEQRAVSAPMFKNTPIDRLADLCKQRDRLQEQVDETENALEAVKGQPGAEMMAFGTKSILSPVLDWYNEQISELQREMERAEA